MKVFDELIVLSEHPLHCLGDVSRIGSAVNLDVSRRIVRAAEYFGKRYHRKLDKLLLVIRLPISQLPDITALLVLTIE